MGIATAPEPTTVGLTRREQLAFVVFSTWIIAGLFLDGWSHEVNKPETFFTPWHALLYSGFGAAVLWSGVDSRISKARGEPVSQGLDSLATVGVLLFAAGMVADFVWHAALGIEVNVEGLLSPTHLTLMTGGLIMAATPARMAMADHAGAGKPLATFGVVQSIAATVAVIAFFTQFASAFRGKTVAANVVLHGMGPLAEDKAIRGVVAIMVTNVLLVGAVTYATSRWRLPRGALALIVGVPALAVSGLNGFDHAALVAAAVLGGIAGDVAVARHRADLAPIAVPLVLWSAWVAIAALVVPFGWSPNIWGGAIFLSVLTGVGLRLLAGAQPDTAVT